MTSCPSLETLRSLIDEKLDYVEMQGLSEHVENCMACQAALAELTAVDQYQHAHICGEKKIQGNNQRSELLDRLSDRLMEGMFDSRVVESSNVKPDFPNGFRFGEYEVLGEIGRGGMGSVYRARHTKSDQMVAVKVLPADHQKDGGRIARFRRETRVISKLSYPNIVGAIDAGQEGDFYYLVMEYLKGVDLQAIIRGSGGLEYPDACEIARQSAMGLQHLHQQGLVHRDIKPSNIRLTVVDGQPIVKLLDLGLARNADIAGSAAVTQLTQTGRIIGTLDYMAPEQFGESGVDIRADIYSLGVTLFALLTGNSPFSSESSNLLTLLKRRATEPTTPIENLRDDLPPELCRLINQMLLGDPDQRPSPPQSVVDQLEPFCPGNQLIKLIDNYATESSLETLNMGSEQTNPVGINRKRSNFDPQRQTQPAKLPGSERSKTKRWKWVATAVGFIALALMASIIVLRLTDGGKITIKSHDPKLKIEVVRNSNEVKSFEVGQLANETWFRSGDYEIRIPSKSDDRIVIEKQNFTLKRGQKKIVSISLEPAIASNNTQGDKDVVPTSTIFSQVTGKYVTWEFPDGGRYVKNLDGTWSVYFAKGGKRRISVHQVSIGDKLPVVVNDPYHDLYFRFSEKTTESSRDKGKTWHPFYSGKGTWVWPSKKSE